MRLQGMGKIDRTAIRTKSSKRLVPDYDLVEEAEDEELEY